MKVLRGTAGADVLAGSGHDGYQLIGLGGNDTYTMRLFDYVVYPTPIPGVDDGEPKTYYVRDDVVEAANGGIDSVRLTVAYGTVGLTGIYPNATVTAAELANIENVTLVSNGHSLWNVSTDGLANTVHGSTLADTIDGNAGNDRLYGGGGGDLIDGGLGADFVYGEDGDDRLTDLSGDNALYGGDGDDVLTAGSGRDALYGADGVDQLIGGAGVDSLLGGDGDDVLAGGAGADKLIGGAGVDVANYAGAAQGVTANLTVPSVNAGDAKGDAYSSVETLVGSKYGDTLTGDAGANRLDGGAGNDTLKGGGGNDQLRGGLGVDRLEGGAGNDQFFAVAAQGRDDMFGGSGRDVFNFAVDTHLSDPLGTIGDFEHGLDTIRFSGGPDLSVSIEQVGANAVVTVGTLLDLGTFGMLFNGYGAVTLQSTDADSITSADVGGVTVYRDEMF